MTIKKLTSLDIELAVANHLNVRMNLIVPNVYWGFMDYECDLLVITKAGYAWEVEIKVSKADLIRDKEKYHNHNSDKIKLLYFAIPDYLLKHSEHIPDKAGIFVITQGEHDGKIVYYCQKKRNAIAKSNYKLTEQEHYDIARLGALRIWGLKKKLKDCQARRDELEKR